MKKIFFLLLVILSACSEIFHSDDDDRVVARANDKELHISELAARIPDGLSERDSITLAENYIAKWIQNEILTQKAKESLQSEDQDFTRQLDEYRNSLLLYALEQKLVQQYLDTVVSPAQIEAYFMQNRGQFELKGNIVKFDFIKITKRSRNVREFRNLLKSENGYNWYGSRLMLKRMLPITGLQKSGWHLTIYSMRCRLKWITRRSSCDGTLLPKPMMKCIIIWSGSMITRQLTAYHHWSLNAKRSGISF